MARGKLKNIAKLLDSMSEQAPVEKAFLTDLKRSIEMEEAKNKRPPSQTYKPSSMNCVRNMYYQVTGATQDESSTGYVLINICNSGTDIHERIQKSVDAMHTNGIDCEYVDVGEYVKSRNMSYLEVVSKNGMETKLYHKTLNISFLCDGIIKYKGQYYIIELKTESIYKWQTRKDVDPKHYNQGIAYSLIFDIPNVIFVYINRDLLDMKSFMFTPTEEQKQGLVDRINACDECVKSKKPPDKPDDLPNHTCDYCSYKGVCNRDG